MIFESRRDIVKIAQPFMAGKNKMDFFSPVGTNELFIRPYGTGILCAFYSPAINGWAIFSSP